MQLLSEIQIRNEASVAGIQLLQGDCTAIPPEHNADILVVSAFPNDYTPLPGSLMYALKEKGIDVGLLANNKAVDLVSQLGCWMSQPLSDEQQRTFNFKQILCFEPRRQSGAPEGVVGNIFRCINNFAFDDDNNAIAMPLLATGKQRVPMATMLPAMLDASIFWLEAGIPLDYIKLIVKDDVQARAALPVFEKLRKAYEAKHAVAAAAAADQGGKDTAHDAPIGEVDNAADGDEADETDSHGQGFGFATARAGIATDIAMPARVEAPETISETVAVSGEYDFFISYSHEHTPQVAELVTAMLHKNDRLHIFYDHSSIPPGGQWVRQISEAIQRSKTVVCILSPQYRSSDVCWDEFQCAKAKEYRSKKSVIKTINFLNDPDMPLIMSLYSYIDCTEGDMQKLRNAVKTLC